MFLATAGVERDSQAGSGLGAQVIITEVQPIPALEAAMDSYQVMPLIKAYEIGEVFITPRAIPT